MKCKESRTIFNLFEVYNCYGCEKYKKDEHLVIGERNVFIYYINSGCQDINAFDNDKDALLKIAISRKLKLLLKDMMISKLLKKKLTIAWIDDVNIENLIYDLLSLDNDVHIII